jgi:hypothetical protein
MARLWHQRTPFTRATGGAAVISPDVAWEGNSVQEPCVLYEGGTFKMWYHGQWTSASSAIGYATCTGDPRVAANWTKYAANPVLGQGGSSLATQALRPTVVNVSGTYYCFFTDGTDLYYATSANGIAWGAPTKILTHGTPTYVTSFQNTEVFQAGVNDWRLLVECGTTGFTGITWATIMYTATTPAGPWTQMGNGVLNSLAIPGQLQAFCSNPQYLGQYSGVYYLLYHVGSNNYSHLRLASSTDLATWTPRGPILFPALDTHEAQQTADGCIVEVGGVSYLFYSGVNNTTSHSWINAASYPRSLASFFASLPAAPSILGQTYPWTTTSGGVTASDLQISGPHTAPASGTFSALNIYLTPNTSGPATCRGVVYADSGGAPGALVAVGTEVTIPVGVAGSGTKNWFGLPFASPVSITSGSKYWLGIWAGSAGISWLSQTTASLSFTTLKNSKRKASVTYSSSGNPSDPFGTATSTTTPNEFPVYAVLN